MSPADITAQRSAAPISDQPLRRDIRMLGFELGKVLKEHGSPELFQLVEDVRYLSKQRRAGDAGAEADLRDKLQTLTTEQIENLIRALSCYFDLANLAEDRHRVRVLRHREQAKHPEPRAESIGAAIASLKAQGRSADEVREAVNKLCVELVLTAHPTEAKRRTVRNLLKRLRTDLIQLDRAGDSLTPRERGRLMRRIHTDLDCLWETDSLRPKRPTVLGEVARSKFVYDTLWDVTPWLARQTRVAFETHYPGESLPNTTFMKYGSWIGGDRDGNPYVTASVTEQTLIALRAEAFDKHLGQCQRMIELLSISQKRHRVSDTLEAQIAAYRKQFPEVAQKLDEGNPDERYRMLLRLMRQRLRLAKEAELPAAPPTGAYECPSELTRDLELLRSALNETGHTQLAEGELQDWIDQTQAFGFHLARLDVREDSAQLHAAIDQLAVVLGLHPEGGYQALDEAGKQAFLTADLDRRAVQAISRHALPEAAREALDLFVLLEQVATNYGTSALGCLIVSMSHTPSDVLTMLWLGRLAAARLDKDAIDATLPIVPLFETIDDLDHAHDTINALMAQPTYAEHVREKTGALQVCMVGYSDSAKDGGYLASNWRLYTAQQRLAEATDALGIELMLFHGRGGALGRGGGPAARSVLSLPPEAVQHRLRVTEQGEVLAERYDDPEIAYRHLEQVTWATLLVSEGPTSRETVPAAASDLLEMASNASEKAYRTLKGDPGFLAYFDQATPIDTIENLPIGSRPSRRRAQRKLEHLRAIPYTFAWTQNRHLITAFFGMGSGLHEAARNHPGGESVGWAALQDLYKTWPAFHAIIDNAEIALAKADMDIAAAYASQLDDPEIGRSLFAAIHEEYTAAVNAVLHIKDQAELLDRISWFKHAIRARNPYIDPLNFIQIELFRRAKALPAPASDAPQDDPAANQRAELTDLLRLSVQGIAAGLRTTG